MVIFRSSDTVLILMSGVYYALVHSYLRYGISSWGFASASAIQPLISLVNRVVRIITFAPFGNIDVKSIFKYLDIPNVHDTIAMETGKFMFKKTKGLLPVTDIANHFNLKNANRSQRYNLRSRGSNMATIEYSSSHGEKSIQNRGSKLWNDLPHEIINSETLSIFKRKLKSHLLHDSLLVDDDDIYWYY